MFPLYFQNTTFAAWYYTITPEDGRIRPKLVEPHNTYNKAITFVHQVGYLFHIMFKMHGHKNLKFDFTLFSFFLSTSKTVGEYRELNVLTNISDWRNRH
jgi:hypothetical protein